jgi:hypothetical protein
MENLYAEFMKWLASVRRQHEPVPESYACQRCGRRDGLDAVVSNEMWEQISGRSDGGGILCLWCMDELAQTRGVGGCVTLHFCGRALYGSSDVVSEALSDIQRTMADFQAGEIDPRLALEAIAGILQEEDS